VGAIDLTALLWREREAMRAVLERLQELATALEAPDRGRVDTALSAFEDARDRLRPIVLARDIEVAAVEVEWRAPVGLTLADLPRYAPPGPWGEILADHLAALRALAAVIAGQRREVDRLLASRGMPGKVRLPVSPEDYEDLTGR
jgi:hypothetical protein